MGIPYKRLLLYIPPSPPFIRQPGNEFCRSCLFLLLFLFTLPLHARPRLVVLVVVDQMRADYLERFRPEFKGGFKQLLEEGAVLTQTRLFHVPAETAPGHACILTGAPPGENGIIGNDWFDRKTGVKILSTYDPIFTISPKNLAATTVGDELKAISPQSRVIALSFKDRGAVWPGGKKADVAIWFNRAKAQFETSDYYQHQPAWLDAVNEEYKYAFFNPKKINQFARGSGADEAVLKLAKRALVQENLGLDEVPDLLTVSFSATDIIGHRVGPDAPEMRAHLLKLDLFLGELMAAVRKISEDRIIMALTADNSVIPVAESAEGKKLKAQRIRSKYFQAQVQKVLRARFGGKNDWAKAITVPDIYFDRDQVKQANLNWDEFLSEAAKILDTVEQVEQVYIPSHFQEKDPYTEVYRRSYFPERSGDLFIRLKHGVVLTDFGQGTTHGSPYDYDTHIPLIFWGQGIKKGTYDYPSRSEDVAPLLAKQLGIPFPKKVSLSDLFLIFSTN
jgi:predicted AlkP superfamily pyrophosphatase or phosphodiesterase